VSGGGSSLIAWRSTVTSCQPKRPRLGVICVPWTSTSLPTSIRPARAISINNPQDVILYALPELGRTQYCLGAVVLTWKGCRQTGCIVEKRYLGHPTLKAIGSLLWFPSRSNCVTRGISMRDVARGRDNLPSCVKGRRKPSSGGFNVTDMLVVYSSDLILGHKAWSLFNNGYRMFGSADVMLAIQWRYVRARSKSSRIPLIEKKRSQAGTGLTR